VESTNLVVGTGEFGNILNGQAVSETFGHILANGLPSLYRGAYRLLGNSADAEDAVQDALLAAFTHLNQFRGQAKMSTWLGAIVHNSARMQLRRRLHHIHVPLDEPIGRAEETSVSQQLADCRPSPEDECRSGELSRRLAHFQNQLTPTLRKTFQLRDIDGLSIREAAKILGVPLGTVKAQSARARKRIRQLMRRAVRSKACGARTVAHVSQRTVVDKSGKR
jgi:RNA polymerase sigma-70 factor, ECF subfamily